MKPTRPQKKSGPRTEFAWLVDAAIKAYQLRHRTASLELVQNEIATEIAISVRTLQAWRSNAYPKRYEDLKNFAQTCLKAAPALGQQWIIDLFRTAGLSSYTDRALVELEVNELPTDAEDLHALTDRLMAIHYIDPEVVFQRLPLTDFVDRPWLTARLDAFLNDPTHRSGVFVIAGEPGVGKTTYLAHLVQQRQYVHVFGEQAPGPGNESRAQHSLAAQLIKRYQLGASLERPDLLDGWEHGEVILQRVLQLAAKQLRPDQQLVIVVDAVNEVGIRGDGNVLGLPVVLPVGVYLLLSKTLTPIHLGYRQARHTERLDATRAENLDDLRAYLRLIAQHPEIASRLRAEQCSVQEFETALVDRSSGIWACVQCALAQLRTGGSIRRDDRPMPVRRAVYHTEQLRGWRDDRRWDELYAPLLAALAVAGEPMQIEPLIRQAGVNATPREVKRLLRESWCSLVREHQVPNGDHAYALSHRCLQKFVSGQVERTGLPLASQYLIDDLQERTIEAHDRIAADRGERLDNE